MRRPASLALFGILTAAGTAALADEGRIPVFQSTSLTKSGHYVVTRDIIGTAGLTLVIQADDVTLDLNGHTISNTVNQPVIYIAGTSNNVVVKNGYTSGGSTGVLSATTVPTNVRIESVGVSGVSGRGIDIQMAATAEILSCRVERPGGDAGIMVNSGTGVSLFSGRFIGNTVSDPNFIGLGFIMLRNGEVRGNTILSPGANGYAIYLDTITYPSTEFGGNLIRDNQVFTPTNARSFGTALRISSSGNIVRNNVVMGGLLGISVVGNDNFLTENLVSRGASDGVFVSGANNHIEANVVQENDGCGIDFLGSFSNIYRNNVLKANTGGATCGVAAINGGGNIT